MLVDELSSRCFNGTWLSSPSPPSPLLTLGGSCLMAAPR